MKLIRNIIIGIFSLFFISLVIIAGFGISNFVFGDTMTYKLMAFVYFVDVIAAIDFFDIKNALGLVGVMAAVSLLLMMFYGMATMCDWDEGFEFWVKNIKEPLLTLIFCSLLVGLMGTTLNKLIPENDTMYKIAGVYLGGSAIEYCAEDNTSCNRIYTKTLNKIEAYLDSVEKVDIEKITDTVEQGKETVEKVEEIINKS